MSGEIDNISMGARADEFAIWLLKSVQRGNEYGRWYVFTTPAVSWQSGPVMEELNVERLREVLGILGSKHELVQENTFIWKARVFSFDKEKLARVVDKIELKRASREGAEKVQTGTEPAKVKA